MVNWAPLLLLPVAAVAWYRVNRAIYHDGFSPLNVLLFAWGIPLMLRSAGLSELEQAWGAGTLILVGWVTFTLIAASVIFAPAVQRWGGFAETRAEFDPVVTVLRRTDLLVLALTVYALAFAAYAYAEFVTNPVGVPLVAALRGERLSLLGADLHRWGKDTRWSIVSPLLFVLSPLCFLAFRVNRGRWVRWVLLIAALTYPVMGALKLSRSDVFIGTLSILTIDHYYHRYAAPSTTPRRGWIWFRNVGLLGMSLGIYYALMTLRIGGSSVGQLYGELIGFRWRSDNPLAQLAAALYGYGALPLENFHRFFVSYDAEFRLGIGVFRPLLAITGQGEIADAMDARVPYPDPVSGAAGSATFLTNLYAEMGLIGVAVVPLLYALLVNGLYARFRLRPSLASLLLYVNFIYPWSWLYFNNAFSVLTFYLNAAFIVVFAMIAAGLARTSSVGATGGMYLRAHR